jgi:hypothetical protein
MLYQRSYIMSAFKILAFPGLILAIGLTVGLIFSSLEPVGKPTGTYATKADAIASSFK